MSKDILNEFDTRKIVMDNNKINCNEIMKNLNIQIVLLISVLKSFAI